MRWTIDTVSNADVARDSGMSIRTHQQRSGEELIALKFSWFFFFWLFFSFLFLYLFRDSQQNHKITTTNIATPLPRKR